jgi:1-deoxy-D-xylulose-5-phosphate synthase
MVPADESECRRMLTTGFQLNCPTAVRYPRGSGTGVALDPKLDALPVGKGEIRRQGAKVAILAFGTLLTAALEAAPILDATVANMRFVKPLDHALLRQLATSHDYLVSIEENTVVGGAGAEVAHSLAIQCLGTPLLRLGLPDHFIEHGDQGQMLAELGLDATGIIRQVQAFIS